MAQDLDERFEEAAEAAKDLPERPSNEDLLEMYSLYKQATEGDVSGKRPGLTDFRGRAKFDAWKDKKGMDREEAKRSYISLVERLQNQ
jgi:acyl-CoA-binding protein